MPLMINTEAYDAGVTTATGAIQQCVLANRVLANEKVVDAYGHVSVRNPENPNTFFIARALAPEFVTEEDILEVDLQGNVVSNTDKTPYGERVIHSAIYRVRSDVNCVCHAHPHPIVAFASTRMPLGIVFHSSSMFYDGIPLYEAFDKSSGLHIVTHEEGDRVARALGKKRGLMLRNHGMIVVGEDVPRTVMASIFIRDNAAILLQCMTLGKPRVLSRDEAEKCTEIMFSKIALERAWNYWVAKARQTFTDI